MKYRNLFFVMLLAGTFFSCLSNSKLDSDFVTAALMGKITDMDNQPCSNVTVTIDNSMYSISDINGSFYFNAVTRGVHTFKFSKPGYKEEFRDYDFLNISQVIYQKMISLEQILSAIETALDEKKFSLVQDYLIEGEKIDDKNPILNYLYGVFYFKAARYDLAIAKLEELLKAGYDEAFLYLTLADLYEYHKGDLVSAHNYILKYMESVDDNLITARERMLADSIAESTTEEKIEQ